MTIKRFLSVQPLMSMYSIMYNHITLYAGSHHSLAPCAPPPPPLPPLAGLGALPPPHLLTSIGLHTGLPAVSVAHSVLPTTTATFSGATLPTITATTQSTPATIQNTPLLAPLAIHSPTPGLVISPASAPFPKKLVDKAKSGQFVEMKEMLANNIALLNQIESVQGTAAVSQFGANRLRLREVTSLATWYYCFLAITTADPTTRDQLAYAWLIIREAQRHWGSGWLEYDCTFRQQAVLEPLTLMGT